MFLVKVTEKKSVTFILLSYAQACIKQQKHNSIFKDIF